jgi:hypothetical protein
MPRAENEAVHIGELGLGLGIVRHAELATETEAHAVIL